MAAARMAPFPDVSRDDSVTGLSTAGDGATGCQTRVAPSPDMCRVRAVARDNSVAGLTPTPLPPRVVMWYDEWPIEAEPGARRTSESSDSRVLGVIDESEM